jgi:hypothetical protein
MEKIQEAIRNPILAGPKRKRVLCSFFSPVFVRRGLPSRRRVWWGMEQGSNDCEESDKGMVKMRTSHINKVRQASKNNLEHPIRAVQAQWKSQRVIFIRKTALELFRGATTCNVSRVQRIGDSSLPALRLVEFRVRVYFAINRHEHQTSVQLPIKSPTLFTSGDLVYLVS